MSDPSIVDKSYRVPFPQDFIHKDQSRPTMYSTAMDSITRPDSPKVTREKKSRDFDVSNIRSPRTTRRERGETNLQKAIFDQNNWTTRYQVENDDFAKGAYGKIILAIDKVTKERVVIKKIARTTPIKMINAEVRAGQLIGKHSNIPSFIQYNDRSDFHYLIFDYANGIDLFTYLERINFSPRSEEEARSTITQVLDALQHVHTYSISHRDVKLENILIERGGKAWLIDFGLCAFVEEGKPAREWCGSDNYLAPEIVRRIPYNPYKADTFSTGVVLFALLFGVFPFENLRVNGAHSIDASRPLRKLQVRFPTDVKVSRAAKELLVQMLEDDPEKRITIQEVLKHEWITGDECTPMEILSSESSARRI